MTETNKINGHCSGRREHRIFAFQVLYSLPFYASGKAVDLEDTFDIFAETSGIAREKENNFAWALVSGVLEHSDRLDEIIGEYSRNWKLGRIARVELSIIRLAVFEILCRHDIPNKVTLNEAVEIAKKFGDEHSKNFINGILDAVAKDMQNGKLGICPRH
ncbi:MAG: transcription antitermination factor NusB [Thermodesulfobacteriota bacterium]